MTPTSPGERCRTCSAKITKADRKRKRCGRCGLHLVVDPPKYLKKSAIEELKSGGYSNYPVLDMNPYHCRECRANNHKACDQMVMLFCQCRRADHEAEEVFF